MTRFRPAFLNLRAFIALLSVAALTACTSTTPAPEPSANEPVTQQDPALGTLTLRGGRSRAVHPDELTFSGRATYVWPDGRRYSGRWKAGLPHGEGRDERPDGTTYEGSWERGAPHGDGTLNQPDGSRYQGSFRAGLRSGYGVADGPSGRYEGAWENDLPHGEGVRRYADGSQYEGAFVAGERSGSGTLSRPDGSTYEGTWLSDAPHGFGTLSDGELTYEGEWQGGQRHGYGTLSTRYGLTFEGTWQDGKRHGFGREARFDGSAYVGEWERDARNGQGTETRGNGARHEGQWELNTTVGPGVRTDALGFELSGVWLRDSISNGLLRLPDGSEYAGPLYRNRNTKVSEPLLAWLTETATNRNRYAAYLLGLAYTEFSEPAADLNEAARWLTAAAEQDYAPAQFALSRLLLSDADRTNRGLELLLAAADQGFSDAEVLLGTYYQTGTHLPRNPRLAIRYFERATEHGNLVARNNLAWMLATTADDALRDGTRAVELASPLARVFDEWGYLDTLAAALAETGDFPAAIAAQEQALSRAADVDARASASNAMASRLDLYRLGQPYREP